MSEKNGLGGLATHAGRVALTNAIAQAKDDASVTRATERRTAVTFRGVALCSIALNAGGLLLLWYVFTAGVRDHIAVVYVDYNLNEKMLDPAPSEPTNPGENAIRAVLTQWVENVRWVTPDKRIFAYNWSKVESFSTQATIRQLDEFRQAQQARIDAGRRVQVQVTQLRRVPKEAQSYTVSWREEAYDTQGTLLRDESGIWTATLTLADFTSKVAKQELSLRRAQKEFRNLFGLFIDGIRWDRQPLPPGPERRAS